MAKDVLPSLPPAARALLRYWKEARGPHVLPHRSALDPIRLREWLPDLSIVEVQPGDKRFFVRVHGTATTENIGQDLSRQYLEDMIESDALEVALIPYQTAIKQVMPVFSVVEPEINSGIFTSLDRLMLPFTDVDQSDDTAPVSVDRFLTWVGPTDLLRGEDASIYRTKLPFRAANGQPAKGIALWVVDVDDARYGLDKPSQSSAPFAAQRPEAKHA